MKTSQSSLQAVVQVSSLCDDRTSRTDMFHMKIVRNTIFGFFVFLSLFVHVPAYAQETIDDRNLQSLYTQLLRNPDDTYVQGRIATERQRIRRLVEAELQQTVTPEDEAVEDVTELPKAVDRQRTIVEGLTERVREYRVDLDLLVTEEGKYYSGEVAPTPTTSTGAVEQLRLTQTHPELLAKKAVLEERIAATESALLLQEDRLSKLLFDQRVQQFGVFITIGKYILILLVIWFAERSLRTLFFAQIHDAEKRYTYTKFFSAGVYILTTIWLIGVVLNRNPGIISSLAIVGAGLTISLQDIVKDLLGWILIIQNKVFTKGDRVTIGSQTGEVVDIGVFNTKLLEIVTVPGSPVLEHTGKILSSPNALVLTQQVINHNTTSDFVKAEVTFDLTFESNWRKAEGILQKILEEVTGSFTEREHLQHAVRTRLFYISRAAGKPRVFMDIAADGIAFTLRFTVPIGDRRIVVTEITKRVLDAFAAESDIELAYKTTRSISTPEEPKTKKEE